MTVVYQETGLTPLTFIEDSNNGPRHWELTLYKGSGSTLRKSVVYKALDNPENSPFDLTKTFKITIEEE